MARDTVHVGGYLPLFAGSEIVRRSGSLTQFASDNLLGNLPPIVTNDLWYDDFETFGYLDLYNHVANVGTGDKRYSVNCCGLVYVSGGRVEGVGPVAATRDIPLVGDLFEWTMDVYGPLDSSFQFNTYASGQAYGGFDDGLVRMDFGFGTGPGNRIMTMKRGVFSIGSDIQSVVYTPGEKFKVTTQFYIPGAYATTYVQREDGTYLGEGGITTSIPTARTIYGEFRVGPGEGGTGRAQMDKLRLRRII